MLLSAEIWADAAIFVPPDDEHALYSALRELIENPDKRQTMGARALVRAGRYLPQQMARGYLAAYRELVGAGAHAPRHDKTTITSQNESTYQPLYHG